MSQSIPIALPEGQLDGTSASLSLWLVKEGDVVKAGDPVAELETDKVAMEVVAPADGVISELIAKVGDAVATEQVIATMQPGAAQPVEKPASSEQTSPQVIAESPATVDDSSGDARQLLSPVVRRLAREHQIDLAQIKGSGKGGRITRNDLLAYLESRKTEAAESPTPASTSQAESSSSVASGSPFDAGSVTSRPLQGRMVPHTNMRKSIAAHMVESLLHTSPHVTSVFEMDMGNIIEHRRWHKKEFADYGVNLTFTAYFLSAMAQAVKKVPQVNARFHEDALEIFDDVNIGVGTALGDQGLVVPVIEQVQNRNLFSIAKALTEQTEKARSGKLTPADMRNGTITISNHGVSGSLFAAPIIINQPQVAIVGIGKLEKRPVVETVNGEDRIVIRPKCYVSLSIDHRALDAHQTNAYLAEFVRIIENWGE